MGLIINTNRYERTNFKLKYSGKKRPDIFPLTYNGYRFYGYE